MAAGPIEATESPSEDSSVSYPERGFHIGEYAILDMFGHGTMSTVFRASDTTGHEVALKVIHETEQISETILERFRREIEASKQLREHRNIVTTFTTGKDRDFHYIAMQKVESKQTLEHIIQETLIPIPDGVELVCKIARALAFAHNNNILHRDIKPSNILIDGFGEPLLSDFGVAALLEWPTCTISGALTGTPLYMSPEQVRGGPLTPASDLYALGVILFEIVTGVLPYRISRDASIPDTLKAVEQESPRRPRTFRPQISRDLEAVIMKTLTKAPANRYADGEALAKDLENAVEGRRVSARQYFWWHRVEHTMWHNRQVLALGVALVIATVSATTWFSHQLNIVHYENLIGLAHLRNSQVTVQRLRKAALKVEPPLPATNTRD